MRQSAIAFLTALLAGSGPCLAGDAPAPSPNAALEQACIRLVGECMAARQATDREPSVVEHPPGVLFKRTPPDATRHMVNAIAIARDIKQRYGALPPACAQACDGVLK
jgi:hypothetical protein